MISCSINLFEPDWDAEVDANGAVLRDTTRLAVHAGAHRLAANLYELEPGALLPLHFHHHNEELMFVLSGTPAVRRGDHDVRARPGEMVAFPAGPDGIHQIVNRSDQPARVSICATNDLAGGRRTSRGDRAVGRDHGRRAAMLPRSPVIPDALKTRARRRRLRGVGQVA